MGSAEVTDGAVRAALTRVLESEGFRAAPRLCAFLRFVVERTLAGEAASLKGYTIATGALGRPEDFDPQTDPIVRVEAGRLRRALDSYYAGPGRDDPLVIAVPRGRYVPEFRPVQALVAPEAPVAARSSAPTSRAAIAAAAAGIGFLLGVLSTTLLAPRDVAGALAWRAEARDGNSPSVVLAPRASAEE